MTTPEHYFNTLGLWDLDTLKQHAEHNGVDVITSERYPGIVMLHYTDECEWEKRWTTFSRMSRGLIVHLPSRKILTYPFNKFFNLGAMPETSYDHLQALGKFEVSEKLDGSMCIPFQDPNTGEFRMTTKGSLDSEHGILATALLPDHFKVPKLLEDYTLVFELISKRFQIVIDYAKKGYPEGLYLIGIRHRKSNELLSYGEVQDLAKVWNMPTLKLFSFDSLDALIDNAKNLSILDEGYVLRFKDDLLVKVKGTAYVKAHRFISKLSDRYLIEALGDGTEGDILSICPEEYLADVEGKIRAYREKARQITDECYRLFSEAPKDTRKAFALWVNINVPEHLRGFLFTILDGKTPLKKKLFDLVGRVMAVSTEVRI